MDDHLVHPLTRRMASVIAILVVCAAVLSGCSGRLAARKALAEANTFPSAIFDIEIVGQNGLATLAYKTQVLHISEKAQWDGLATISAYNMVFQQECNSIYSENLQAKLWRDKWVQSSSTTPAIQLRAWLQMFRNGSGVYDPTPVPADSLPPFPEGDSRSMVTVQLKDAPLDWDSICDVHIDSLFGTQAFLTDLKTGTVVLYFDASTLLLAAATFTAEQGGTSISGIIEVSASDGHTFQDFPLPETVSDGTLYEEWTILGS